MANDMIETALASTLEELEAIKRKEEEQTKLLSAVKERMDKIEEVLKEVKQQAEKPISTVALEMTIVKGVNRLQQTIEAQPKAVVHERRILLFPEYGAKEYYKTVVGRLSLSVIAVIITSFLFLLCKQAVTDWYTVHSQESKLNEYKNTLQRLYLEEQKLKNDREKGNQNKLQIKAVR